MGPGVIVVDLKKVFCSARKVLREGGGETAGGAGATDLSRTVASGGPGTLASKGDGDGSPTDRARDNRRRASVLVEAECAEVGPERALRTGVGAEPRDHPVIAYRDFSKFGVAVIRRERCAFAVALNKRFRSSRPTAEERKFMRERLRLHGNNSRM